jgi:acetyl esterase/lipase
MRARLHVATIVVVATAAAVLTAAGATSSAARAVPNVGAALVRTRVVGNLAYAPAQPAGSLGHLLDLYLPGGTAARPLVIWTGGSAWRSDNGKSGASSIAATFNAAGYAVAGVSVRSSSQAKFPAQVYDIKAAIRWLRAKAAQYRLDVTRFAIMGDSSGGWISAMATLTGNVSPLEGDIGTPGFSSTVQAGVDFFGPTDFLRMSAQRLPGGSDRDSPDSPESLLLGCAIRTCPGLVAQANPIGYVDRDDPPMLLVHGQADNVVPHGQSVILYNALIAACRNASFISVPGANHGLSEVMAPPRFGTQKVYTNTGCQPTIAVGSPNPTWATVIGFLNSALGP